jgi:hypothetical protein
VIQRLKKFRENSTEAFSVRTMLMTFYLKVLTFSTSQLLSNLIFKNKQKERNRQPLQLTKNKEYYYKNTYEIKTLYEPHLHNIRQNTQRVNKNRRGAIIN